MKPSSRRAFLRTVGGGFASLPFFRLIENSYAQSMGDALPLKFVGIYHPHGVCAEHWVARGTDTETSFDLEFENSSLSPLAPFKDRLIAIEGIDILSSANGHDTCGAILTGSRINGDLKPSNSSLDQFLAVEHKLGSATRVTSVALAVGTKELKSGTTLSFGPGGEPLSKIIDPVKAYDLLFEGFSPSGMGSMPDPAAERKKKLAQANLAFVRADVKRLEARLSGEERQKLEQHLTSLSELEKQFSGMPSSGSVAGCAPKKPGAIDKLEQYNGGEPFFDAITDAHIDVLAQALACDVTRFATLFMNDLSYTGNPLGLPADNHGSVAHTYSSSDIGQNGRPVGAGDPSTWLPLSKFNKYSYSKVARLMQKLDELGVLDSTIIYVSSDMGNPALHSTRNVPTLIAGGANGAFRMGRRLKVAADCPASSPWCGENDAVFEGVTNNHILVSIANAFGVDIDSFGQQPEAKHKTGALAELA
jgi:Protein of unknown function (DUF1552)